MDIGIFEIWEFDFCDLNFISQIYHYNKLKFNLNLNSNKQHGLQRNLPENIEHHQHYGRVHGHGMRDPWLPGLLRANGPYRVPVRIAMDRGVGNLVGATRDWMEKNVGLHVAGDAVMVLRSRDLRIFVRDLSELLLGSPFMMIALESWSGTMAGIIYSPASGFQRSFNGSSPG